MVLCISRRNELTTESMLSIDRWVTTESMLSIDRWVDYNIKKITANIVTFVSIRSCNARSSIATFCRLAFFSRVHRPTLLKTIGACCLGPCLWTIVRLSCPRRLSCRCVRPTQIHGGGSAVTRADFTS